MSMKTGKGGINPFANVHAAKRNTRKDAPNPNSAQIKFVPGDEFPIHETPPDVTGAGGSAKHHGAAGHEGGRFPGYVRPIGGPHARLMWLRANFPFLPIVMFPNAIATAVITDATGASPQNLNIPDGTILIQFKGSTLDWIVSLQGNAEYPTQANVEATLLNPSKCQSLLTPDDKLLYVEGIHQFSVNSKTAGCIVQAHCWFANNIMHEFA